jgi:hypothetical protein
MTPTLDTSGSSGFLTRSRRSRSAWSGLGFIRSW